MNNIQKKLLEYVKVDDASSFKRDINSLENMSDLILEIEDVNTKEEYKIKYIAIVLDILIRNGKLKEFLDDISIENYYKIFSHFSILYLDENINSKLLEEVVSNTDYNTLYEILTMANEEDEYIDNTIMIIIKVLENNPSKLQDFIKDLESNKVFIVILKNTITYFNINFLYKILQCNFKITLDEEEDLLELLKESNIDEDDLSIIEEKLKEKVSTGGASKRKVKKNTYTDLYQDNYCSNLSKDNKVIPDELIPLIVSNTEISLPFKKLLKFNKNKLYEVPEDDIQTIRMVFNSNNFKGGRRTIYNIKEDLNIDLKWYVKSLKYMENLSIRDKMTIMGYTFNGDVYANSYLMNNNSLDSYLKTKIYSKETYLKFFPLYFQAKEKIQKESNNISKYYIGNKTEDLLGFVNLVNTSEIEIDVYNALMIYKGLFSKDFWIDVVKMFCQDLDRIIKNSPVVEKEMILYRGAKDKYYKNSSNIYVNNTFMSTSFDYNIPFQFVAGGCCLKKIILKPGSNCLFMESLTQMPGENEILLGLNNKFKIVEDEVKSFYNLTNYKKNKEYSENLCSEKPLEIEITVMEIIL